MRILRTIILSAALTGLAATAAQAQEEAEAPQLSPVEVFPCSFNEGKDINDLNRVIDRWNAFMDQNDDSGYQAWLLFPDFFSSDYVGWDVGWLGAWPDGNAMGSSLEVWHTKGTDLQRAFFEVISCEAHTNYANMTVKEPTDAQAEMPVVSFSNCSVAEGSNMDAALEAVATWSAYLSEAGSDAAHWVFFPGFGESNEGSYDFKWVTGNPSYTSFGGRWQQYANGGGWQKAQELFGGVLDCDSPRLYTVRPVRVTPQE